MRIKKMTATFGKLQQQTLTLQPGLNIIEAPNEWGKSTWCAFLAAMFYGIDTAERTRQGHLADKERFAPWSGSPMSGSVELVWDGREITIERATSRRIPLGDFRAYETGTGLPVPELTAANCGQVLLGVERAVFTRAGFIRFSDLPVTQNEDLRRRLNALVTTGDESGTAEKLERQLRELKNRCRHNKTGLLPQLEAQRLQTKTQLREKALLTAQVRDTQSRLDAVRQELSALENHRHTLLYDASVQRTRQIESARQQVDTLSRQAAELDRQCKNFLPPDRIAADIEKIEDLCRVCSELRVEEDVLRRSRVSAQIPAHWAGKSREQILEEARRDTAAVKALEKRRKAQNLAVGLLLGLLPLLAFGLGWLTRRALSAGLLWGGIGLGACALAAGIFLVLRTRRFRQEIQALYDRHPGQSPDTWDSAAAALWDRIDACQDNESRYTAAAQKLALTQAELDALVGECDPGDVIDDARNALNMLQRQQLLTRELHTARTHLAQLEALAGPVPPPSPEDTLTWSGEETRARLSAATEELHHLQVELGRLLGRKSTYASDEALHRQLAELDRRIAHLNQTYDAVSLAQDTLREASAQLQRRFAPRISQRASSIFGRLTGGRYNKLALGEDLGLSAAAEDENTLRSVLWRSDGTADQLYLALRIAVAEELSPQAPLILDDALVRFDDERLKAALELLQEEARERQILLFTCHGREKKVLS